MIKKCYLLIYEVKNNLEKWIIKIDDNYTDLKEIIKNVNSHEIGNYYIIRTTSSKYSFQLDKKFKQFQTYKKNYYDRLIYSSKYNLL